MMSSLPARRRGPTQSQFTNYYWMSEAAEHKVLVCLSEREKARTLAAEKLIFLSGLCLWFFKQRWDNAISMSQRVIHHRTSPYFTLASFKSFLKTCTWWTVSFKFISILTKSKWTQILNIHQKNGITGWFLIFTLDPKLDLALKGA